MALVEGLMPPSRENWELLVFIFQLFPLASLAQQLTDWWPQGKTSVQSRFNIPGKIGWTVMEVPGFITLLFVMWTLPPKLGIDQLPKANWLMGVLYTIHYINRAIITPIFLNPSMSPIHPFIILSASLFQVINGTCIGGWLGGYGPTTSQDWNGRMIYIQLGLVVFLLGLIGNIYHDDELREIRRTAAREQRKAIQNAKDAGKQVNVEKVYQVPQAGLFQYILFPHYLCEWIEWVGFWIMGGRSCVPAQSFVLNEIAVMIPRALSGKRWYVNKFGLDKIAGKKAVLPGIL